METAMTIQDMMTLAKQVVAGKLFPSFDSPEKLMTLMMLCQAEGIPPIVAVRRYDIIQGRPALKSDAMLGDFQTRGGKVAWLVYTETVVKAEFSASGLSAPVTVEWTIEMANRAGLAAKPGSWKQYPRAMLKARVISEGIRISMPSIVSGVYTPEEVADMVVIPPLHRVESVSTQAPSESIEAEAVEPITPAQLKAIQTIANEGKIGRELTGTEKRDARIAWINSHLSRVVASTNNLTKAEAAIIIDKARHGK